MEVPQCPAGGHQPDHAEYQYQTTSIVQWKPGGVVRDAAGANSSGMEMTVTVALAKSPACTHRRAHSGTYRTTRKPTPIAIGRT